MRGSTTRFQAVAVLCSLLASCGPKVTQFTVVDYRGEDPPERFFQTFDDCYYCRDPRGNVDIVARLNTTDDDGLATTQAVHIHTFWIPKLGRTNAERTMINATVSYVILTGPTGATFEGSGFVTFKENRSRDRIKGHLELSALSPQRRLGDAYRLFHRAELSGAIVARRDKAKVVSTLNEVRRLFGPMPRLDHTRQPDIR